MLRGTSKRNKIEHRLSGRPTPLRNHGAARKDLEWYRLFLVPGRPAEEGFIIDRPTQR